MLLCILFSKKQSEGISINCDNNLVEEIWCNEYMLDSGYIANFGHFVVNLRTFGRTLTPGSGV